MIFVAYKTVRSVANCTRFTRRKSMKTLNEWRKEKGLPEIVRCSYVPTEEEIKEYKEKRDKNVTCGR